MWKLGRFLGIDVSLHWTLLVLMFWFSLTAPFGGPLFSATLMAAVFACVLLHEFGHSLTARQYGIETSSIVLLPIGGVASLESMPTDPKKEFWIAIGGPLVNVVIASGLYALLSLLSSSLLFSWIEQLMYINIGLVVFNLLPAFPMDGGRIFRATCALFLPYAKATNLAASVGKVMAILLAALGIATAKGMLVFIAIAVFFMGSAEALAVAADPANHAWPTRSRGRKSTTSNPATAGAIFQVQRNGMLVNVVWDEVARVYRYAQ